MAKRLPILILIITAIYTLALCGCGKTQPPDNTVKYPDIVDEAYTDTTYGLDITNKRDLISICYSVWFTRILALTSDTPPVVTDILDGKASWGYDTQFHYWGKPALGFYESHDKKLIRTHMSLLADAGVDFIIVDYTYLRSDYIGTVAWKHYVTSPITNICDTILQMRSEGLKTPYVVFWSYVNDTTQWDVVNELYDQFLMQEKWKDCFVYWNSLPFMLTNRIIDNAPDTLFLRAMWGLKKDPGSEWSFLNIKNTVSVDENGLPEQTCVCVATQESYMTEPTAHGRNHGIFFYTQWARAFSYRPKVITLTWWNEWAAQLSRDGNGNPRFTDNYNMEYSRDIEPVEGGHGDSYYVWMKQYIEAYKNNKECPVLVESGYESEAVKTLKSSS